MYNTTLSVIFALLLAGYGCNTTDQRSATSADMVTEKMKGVSWEARGRIKMDQLRTLSECHVNWIAQTPFGWQQGHNSPEIAFHSRRGMWGERDSGLVLTAQLADSLGIKTMLKPHIWLSRPAEGKWRSDIAMDSPEEWKQWFAQYESFILHHARLAEAHDFAALCIGTELYLTSVGHEAAWRQIIAKVREVYSGKITYAANFYKEYEEIQFWDALDFIGIQAYFPLSEITEPTVEQLKKGWQPHYQQIKQLQKKWNKPIVFTEVGYRSSTDAAIRPWEWEARGEVPTELISATTQARCYQAMFETFWHEPWMQGVFIWKWSPENYGMAETGRRRRSPSPVSFAPKTEAMAVMKKWFE